MNLVTAEDTPDCIFCLHIPSRCHQPPYVLSGIPWFLQPMETPVVSAQATVRVLKTKLNWTNFKDLTGFIQQFINRPASHLADRKELQGVI